MTRLWLIVALLLAPLAHAADTPEEYGLELIPWSKRVADHRYESPRDWDATLKFFRDKFKGWKTVRWSREMSVPAVKYVHIENTAANPKWGGINIYALPDGRIRYYLLAPTPPANSAKAPAGEPKKPSG
jgi:hypothetical protein